MYKSNSLLFILIHLYFHVSSLSLPTSTVARASAASPAPCPHLSPANCPDPRVSFLKCPDVTRRGASYSWLARKHSPDFRIYYSTDLFIYLMLWLGWRREEHLNARRGPERVWRMKEGESGWERDDAARKE